MSDLATLEQWLAEARLARHRLAIGSATVSVRFGDRAVEYSPASVPALDTYIASLERRIAAAKGQRGPAVSPYVRVLG